MITISHDCFFFLGRSRLVWTTACVVADACVLLALFLFSFFVSCFALQAYNKAQAAGKELEVVYVPVADSAEVRRSNRVVFLCLFFFIAW